MRKHKKDDVTITLAQFKSYVRQERQLNDLKMKLGIGFMAEIVLPTGDMELEMIKSSYAFPKGIRVPPNVFSEPGRKAAFLFNGMLQNKPIRFLEIRTLTDE